MLEAHLDFMKPALRTYIQSVLEDEMETLLGARKSERNSRRSGYRSGYYTRELITRVGVIEIRVPQDRDGRFSTELFERYQRSEKALVGTLVQMYVQGVSTRKVKAVTEELCGHSFSASSISRFNQQLDAELQAFRQRPLDKAYPYVILDARYEKVRQNGVIQSQAVLIALGVDWEGQREVLGVELASRESSSSWKEFLIELKERGLNGVQLIISDDHSGLKRAVHTIYPEAIWQRCYVHFLRNALDYLPRKVDENCLLELRWIYERRNLEEAKADLAAWLEKWQRSYPKLCDWVEEQIEETLSFYRFPPAHHKHLKSNNVLERLNEEIRRRTRVIRIFPNEASCLRLIGALAIEIHEGWLERSRYLNMDYLKEQMKKTLHLNNNHAA